MPWRSPYMERRIRHIDHKKAIMKTIVQLFVFSLLYCAVACQRLDTEFESFLKKGEIIYPGVVANVSYYTGNRRVALLWNPSPDPTVTAYAIFWNNKRDSITLDATTHSPSDTLIAYIPNLEEYVYSFTIYSYDK